MKLLAVSYVVNPRWGTTVVWGYCSCGGGAPVINVHGAVSDVCGCGVPI